MNNGPGIVLVATAISFGNNWYQSPTEPDFKILAAGTFFALFDAGIGALLGQNAASGLAVMMLIGVLVSPVEKGKSTPLGTLASLPISKTQTVKGK